MFITKDNNGLIYISEGKSVLALRSDKIVLDTVVAERLIIRNVSVEVDNLQVDYLACEELVNFKDTKSKRFLRVDTDLIHTGSSVVIGGIVYYPK